jgi:hypothetical protein
LVVKPSACERWWIAYFADIANESVMIGGGPGRGNTKEAAVDELRQVWPTTWKAYSEEGNG